MNAIREFAEEIRSQFNRLIHLREIDSEVFELSFEEWNEREEVKQWKKQDIRRLKRHEEIQASSLLRPPAFGKPERMTTRIEVVFRVFDLSSRVVHAQQRAFEYCKDKPHLALLPSIIMNMSVVHRRWRSLFRLEQDDREIQTRWRDAFDELLDWIDEIEACEEGFMPPKRALTTEDEIYNDAKNDFYAELEEWLAKLRAEDGPKAGYKWQFQGNLFDGMDPTAWKLCDYLWNQRTKSSYYDEKLAEAVFSDRCEFVDSVRVGSHRRNANKFFERHSIPYKVQCPKECTKLVSINER